MNEIPGRKTSNGKNAETLPRMAAAPAGAGPMAPSPQSKARSLANDYRTDGNQGRSSPSYRSAGNILQNRLQFLPQVDLNDPIQVHLLTETALLDSQGFLILSSEEVDNLKKQCQALSQRIEQTTTNLTIQTKFRDAAVSMAKLYSSDRQPGRRLSLLGRRSSSGDNAKEAELELLASERRCEDLAAELWGLEKRLMEPQRRILEHTAAILQMTHKDNSTVGRQRGFSNDSDRSGQRGGREQQDLFRSETEKLQDQIGRAREENGQLRAQLDFLTLDYEAAKHELTQKAGTASDMEQRLDILTGSLRQAIVRTNPEKNINYKKPPYESGRKFEAGERLTSQVDYIEQGLATLVSEIELLRPIADDVEKSAERSQDAEAVVYRARSQADVLGNQIRRLLTVLNPAHPPLPDMPGPALDDKLEYLEDSLRVLQLEAGKALEKVKNTATKKAKDEGEQTEKTVRDLWDLLSAGFQVLKSMYEEGRQAGMGADNDKLGLDDGSAFNVTESFSLAALTTRVRTLLAQTSRLLEQRLELQKRLLEQQRGAGIQTSTSSDGKTAGGEVAELRQALEENKKKLAQAEKAAAEGQIKLTQALRNAGTTRSATAASSVDGGSDLAKLEATNQQLQQKLDELEPTLADITRKLQRTEASLTAVDGKVADAVEAKKKAELSLSDKTKELAAKLAEAEVRETSVKNKDEEIERLNVMVIELKTELMFSRAELDAAYGSRRERAAEAAAIKSTDDVIRLQTEADEFKAQLAQTVTELEQITRETLAAEREKLDAETRLDEAVSARATLETELAELRAKLDEQIDTLRAQISKLQEELDDERLKAVSLGAGQGAGANPGTPGTGASLLTEQFRSTMREERKRYQDEIKEEQVRRKKVEEELNRLKRIGSETTA